jgi:pimeloyl-ACP methyl ester carboxylesterase
MDELEPIEVRRYGSRGPTTVVLHGGPGAPGSAAGLARALAADFHVLEPLQRRSGRVALTVSRHVEDLSAVVPQPATLIGWSWGAMLGLSFAARYPRDVAALVLVGCGTYDENSRALLRRTLEERLGEPGRRVVAELESRITSESNVAKRDAILGELGALYMKAESYDIVDGEGESADGLPADEAGHVETWNDVLRLQRDGIEPRAFRAVTARVLMIHGAEDPHPGEATRDLLRRYIPQLEYIELDRCGHEPWRERHARDRFVEFVREWLRRTDSSVRRP